MLKEQNVPIKGLAKPATLAPASAGGPIKGQEDPGTGREASESRQEFFGEIIYFSLASLLSSRWTVFHVLMKGLYG